MATDKIKVGIRVRPFNKKENDNQRGSLLSVVQIEKNQATLRRNTSTKHDRQKSKRFTFDYCFDSTHPMSNNSFASQELVFSTLGEDILDNAFKGYNACLFAYGQTGSGKSYTMMGTRSEPGIIPRICTRLFQQIETAATTHNLITVEVSYMEIYNERVYDLLDLSDSNRVGLKVREHNILGPYVENLSQLMVVSANEIDDLMVEGNKSRTIAATNMNSESSRSHAVFTIIITFTVKDPQSGVVGEKVSRVSLVDLAGSERADKTGAVGERLKEGSNINKSLTTLGLVISKLADQSSGKSKDNFIPYRDSVLTWLLKDSLGGNSRTVMVATLSPAEDNFEETLSTLRYADRAKRITNHAVVNEDPNAKLIRELKAEVEKLKSMLVNTAQPELLKEKMTENENLMKEMSLTVDEKLAITGQKQEERRHALEVMGLTEKGKFFLVNLNSDPSLTEMLVYYLKDVTRIGSKKAKVTQDIPLSGAGIKDEHCVIMIQGDDLCLIPMEDARTCVNGKQILVKTVIKDGDRLLWGSNHFFRVNCHTELGVNEDSEKYQQLDWSKAQEELMVAEGDSLGLDDMIAKLEKKYEKEKQVALEKQKLEYEIQFNRMLEHDIQNNAGGNEEDSGVISWLENVSPEKTNKFKKSLGVLRHSILQANGLAREANQLAKELERNTKFLVTLQIPPENLSPNNQLGTFMTEPSILLNRKGFGRQVWNMDKLETRLISMREVYNNVRNGKAFVGNIGQSVPDPFFDPMESHTLIGVANIYLTALFHGVKFEYYAPIISQNGTISGKLLVQIQKLDGSFPLDRVGHCDLDSESTSVHSDDASKSPLTVQLSIQAVVGLPPSLAHFVFCQYKFWNMREFIVVPSMIESRNVRIKNEDTVDFRFDHVKTLTVYVDEDFVDFCEDGALSIQVYGHKENGFFSIREAMDQKRKAQTLADRYSIAHPDLCWVCFDLSMKCHHVQSRWSELVRKLQLWIEIHEIDENGKYSPVEVQQREDVGTGGIFQLRHGQQRRMIVRVKPVPNSGNLPIVCDSVVNIEVGSPVARNKLQRPLDSYQDDDINNVRKAWALSVSKLKEFVDAKIHKLDQKKEKSTEDSNYEQSLIDQKNCIVEELNANLVPGEEQGGVLCCQLGLETKTSLIFLDFHSLDTLDSATELNEHLPVIGYASQLPKEIGERFFSLPILQTLDKEIGSVASWDSSVHDSIYLNRVTQDHERLFLIVKATVRISDPVPLDLVLRKRICFAIYKRHSLVSLFRKKVGYSMTNLLKGIGVTYEIVGNVPVTFRDSEPEDNDDNREENEEESFFDDYTQAVSGVETILNLERIKQQDFVLELLAREDASLGGVVRQGNLLKKTISIPNFGRNLNTTSSLLSLNLGPRGGLSGSFQSLNQDTLQKRLQHRSFEPGRLQSEQSLETRLKRQSLPNYKHVTNLQPTNANGLKKSMTVLIEEEDSTKN